jgi:hypothetical protein
MGVDQPDGTFKMILVSDNGCHIWTIAIVELQKPFSYLRFYQTKPHYCRPQFLI